MPHEPMDQIKQDVLRLKLEMHRVIKDLDATRDSIQTLFTRMETRLTELERHSWKSSGALAVIVVIAQILISKLLH